MGKLGGEFGPGYEAFRDICRGELVGDINSCFDSASLTHSNSPEYGDEHFVTEECIFGITCHVVEILLPDPAPEDDHSLNTNKVTIYKPTIDSKLQDYPREVKYWLELGIRDTIPMLKEHQKRGMFLELSNSHDYILKPERDIAGDLNPVIMFKSSHKIMFRLQAKINRAEVEIARRKGRPPYVEK